MSQCHHPVDVFETRSSHIEWTSLHTGDNCFIQPVFLVHPSADGYIAGHLTNQCLVERSLALYVLL